MTDPTPPHDADVTFQHNLAALRHVNADLAERLTTMPLPAGVEPAVGRDGSPTFKLRSLDGVHWLGYTSMPTVSGPALLRSFDPGEGNVVLAGIGQGIEARLLARRLAVNRAVFVLERDVAALALVLRVHDLADALAAGRLVLIVGDDPGEALISFLNRHEGYMPPQRMLGWPWLDTPATDEVKGILQRATVEVTRRRAGTLGTVADELTTVYARPAPLPEHPRTLVICPHVEPQTCRLAGDVAAGLSASGAAGELYLGNAPATSHPLAAARRIAAFRPDAVLLIDAVRGNLDRVLPAGLPVAIWMTPWARLTPAAIEGIGPRDPVFAMTARVMADLAGAGLDPTRVAWLGPAVASCPAPDEDEAPSFEHEVVAVTDALPLAPEANGLTLESHRAVWAMARRLIEQRVERYTDDEVERVLAQAESSTGASFADRSLRRDFCRHINAVLAQTLVRRAALEALLRAGVDLDLFGQGWQEHASLGGRWRGPASLEDRAALYASAKIVLHLDVSGSVTPEVIAAASRGAVVVARSHPTDAGATGLWQLLEPGREILTYKRHAELIGHVKRLLADEPARRAMADCARARISEQHTMSHRLMTMWSALRRSAGTPSTS